MTPLLESFSTALLHFTWQGCLVLALLWVTLFGLRKRSANVRYAAGCVALAALAAAPLLTTYILYQRPAAKSATFAVVAPMPAGVSLTPTTAPQAPVLALVQSWALPAWTLGVLLFSIRMVWGCAQVAALQRGGRAAGDDLLRVIECVSRRMGLAGPPRVLISEWSGGPSLVGWLRPVILLPAAALSGLTPEQLEGVLAHELAHIRRHDYLVNWMQMLVETLLFYHPAVWWISRRVRHERELCCDDLAVSACEDALCYARALTTLERMRASAPVTALGSTDGALFYRIQRIVGAATQEYGPSRASVILALSIALAGLVFSVNWARGQSRPTENYLVQGDALLRSGANDLALQKFQEGMAADPGNRATYQKRCIEVLMRTGRKAEAADVNTQLLKEHPDDTDGLEFGAAMLLDQGNAAAAIAQLQMVLARAPDNPVAHLDLGRAYAIQGNTEAARREIEEAIALRQDFTRAMQALERLAPLAGVAPNEDELVRLQSESAKAPERLELMESLGSAAVRAGKYDLAIYTFQRLLDRMDPASEARGQIYLRLGDAYSRKGDSGAAIQEMEKAHELSPGNRLVLGPLIVLLDAAGRHVEAAQLRTEVDAVPQAMAQLAGLARLSALQPAEGRVLESIYFVGIPEAMRPQVHLAVHIGDTLTEDTVGATYSAMKILDESLDVRFTVLENGRARLVITKPQK